MRKIVSINVVIGVFVLLAGGVAYAQQSELPIKEMTIEVQPRILALPGGSVGAQLSKVPIRMAKVRNTDMRTLNEQFNAVTIERIYEIAAVADESETDNSLKTGEKKGPGFVGKRLLRKTDKGFFETQQSGTAKVGIIAMDKPLKVRKGKKGVSTEMLMTQENTVSEEDIVQVKDVFIIGFQDYLDQDGNVVKVDMEKVVDAYSDLPVVISAVKN